MSRQKTKNIRLLLILVLAVCVVVAYALFDTFGGDNSVYDRKQFTITNTLDIDRVEIDGRKLQNNINYREGKWVVDGKHPADPMRISVFFATMQHVNIRRPAALERLQAINAGLDSAGITVKLYNKELLAHSFDAWGEDDKSITYFRNADGEVYIVEIPGYRSYVYGLVSLPTSEWRNKNVFNKMNWRNLGKISIKYPDNVDENFEIVQGGGFYTISQIAAETDTTKLTDYIDQISLLNTHAYLENIPDSTVLSPSLTIQVFDVGNNSHVLELFKPASPTEDHVTARIDSSEHVTLKRDQTELLFKNTEYFKK